MSMNPSQESFLEQMKDMYTQSHLPCCLLNDQFEILWYNKEAAQAIPLLTMQNGKQILFREASLPKIQAEIAEKGHFILPETVLLPDLLLYSVPAQCGSFYFLQPLKTVPVPPNLQNDNLCAALEHGVHAPALNIFPALSYIKKALKNLNYENKTLDHYLRSIGENTSLQIRNIELISDYTRFDEGVFSQPPVRIDFFQYLRTLCSFIQELLEKKNGSNGNEQKRIELCYEIPDYSLFTLIQTKPLELIFCHLISNSCRFSQSDSRIIIKADQEVRTEKGKEIRYAVISFRDQAGGLPPEIENRIAEPYHFKASSTSGCGLGLPLVLRCITFLGGKLNYITEKDHSTIFRITFPLPDDQDDMFILRSPDDIWDRLELESEIRFSLADAIPYEGPLS